MCKYDNRMFENFSFSPNFENPFFKKVHHKRNLKSMYFNRNIFCIYVLWKSCFTSVNIFGYYIFRRFEGETRVQYDFEWLRTYKSASSRLYVSSMIIKRTPVTTSRQTGLYSRRPRTLSVPVSPRVCEVRLRPATSLSRSSFAGTIRRFYIIVR